MRLEHFANIYGKPLDNPFDAWLKAASRNDSYLNVTTRGDAHSRAIEGAGGKDPSRLDTLRLKPLIAPLSLISDVRLHERE